MDFIDDFIFGPMNLIGRATGALASWSRRSKSKRKHSISASDTMRIAIPRHDKTGGTPVLDVIAHFKKHGIDVIGGRQAVTHDARNFYIVIPLRQLKWAMWLYNNGDLRSPNRVWTAG